MTRATCVQHPTPLKYPTLEESYVWIQCIVVVLNLNHFQQTDQFVFIILEVRELNTEK